MPIFFGVQVKLLWQPLQNLPGLFQKPNFCGLNSWDHCPAGNSKLQLPHRWVSPRVFWYCTEFFLSSTCYRFPVSEEAIVSLQCRTEFSNICDLFMWFWTSGSSLWDMKPVNIYSASCCANWNKHVTKSCCECFAVTWEFLTTCLLTNQVVAVDSFLFLPYRGSVANELLLILWAALTWQYRHLFFYKSKYVLSPCIPNTKNKVKV